MDIKSLINLAQSNELVRLQKTKGEYTLKEYINLPTYVVCSENAPTTTKTVHSGKAIEKTIKFNDHEYFENGTQCDFVGGSNTIDLTDVSTENATYYYIAIPYYYVLDSINQTISETTTDITSSFAQSIVEINHIPYIVYGETESSLKTSSTITLTINLK